MHPANVFVDIRDRKREEGEGESVTVRDCHSKHSPCTNGILREVEDRERERKRER